MFVPVRWSSALVLLGFSVSFLARSAVSLSLVYKVLSRLTSVGIGPGERGRKGATAPSRRPQEEWRRERRVVDRSWRTRARLGEVQREQDDRETDAQRRSELGGDLGGGKLVLCGMKGRGEEKVKRLCEREGMGTKGRSDEPVTPLPIAAVEELETKTTRSEPSRRLAEREIEETRLTLLP